MADKKKVSAAARKAGKIMAATAANKGRKTGYQAAKSLEYNRTAVAGKARAVDAATKGKVKSKAAKVKVTGSSPTLQQAQAAKKITKSGYTTPRTTGRQRAEAALMLIPGPGGAGAKATVAGIRGLKVANALGDTVKLTRTVKAANANLAKGLLTKKEAQKLILDANMEFNRGAFFGTAQLQGISKVTANKLLGKKIPPFKGNRGK